MQYHKSHRRQPRTQRRSMRGVSLIELMVAVTIGIVLIGGAIQMFVESRVTSRINQSIARTQESALFAADEITRSLELAGYWGQNNNTDLVTGATLRSGGTVSTASPMAGATGNCTGADGYEWYTDLHRPIEGVDASGTTEANDVSSYGTCIPDTTYQPGTDLLIVRYVDPAAVPTASLLANTVYVRSAPEASVMFIGTAEPTGMAATANNYRLRAYAYYVSQFLDTPGDGILTLKRASLDTGSGGNPRIVPGTTSPMVEEVVVPGVENLQVQFGIDTTGDGSANKFKNAGGVANTEWDNVVAVRFLLIVRAETAENNYTSAETFALPQENFTPGDAFRRVRVTRTVQVRNLKRT